MIYHIYQDVDGTWIATTDDQEYEAYGVNPNDALSNLIFIVGTGEE